MKKIFSLFLCCAACLSVYSQTAQEITLQVITESDTHLPLAHITINGNNHFITNESGEISFSTLDHKASITISHIGYMPLDTMVTLSERDFFTFTLTANRYSIDPITISDKQRLFEKTNWYLKDITLHEYGFLVSASEKSKHYIYLFNKEGVEILKTRTKFKHSKINKGLKTGHYHLMSDEEGMELMVSTDTIIFLQKSPIEQYNKTINHFKYTNKNYTIAEEWAQHNKKMTLAYIDNKTYERSPFYVAFDRESHTRSQRVYYEIIGLYHRDTNDPELNLLGPGMEGPNIIRDGSWNGDLYELVISDTIQQVYNYYISIFSKNIALSSKIKNNTLYILDDLERKLSIYQLGPEAIDLNKAEIKIPEFIQEGEFFPCDHANELIIKADNNYFSFDIDSYDFVPISFEEKDYNYLTTQFISDNVLYTLARKSRIKPKMSIYRSDRVYK